MAILFDCPFCSYEKEVPDSYEGKKIKCPRCLATLTLGVPQPTEPTALPLPEEDESPLETKAIEVDEKDTLIECPICLALINSHETQCPAYKTFLEQSSTNEQAEKIALEEYQKAKKKVRVSLFLAIVAMLCPGLGFVLGFFTILYAKKIIPLLCENLEMENRHKVNFCILMGILGMVNSVLFFIGLWHL